MELQKLFKEAFNVDYQTLKDNDRLMGFADWDSMTHMLFITRLEETYNINLNGDEIASMQTVGDVKKIIGLKGVTIE